MDVLAALWKMFGMLLQGLLILGVVAFLENTLKNSLRNLRFQRESNQHYN